MKEINRKRRYGLAIGLLIAGLFGGAVRGQTPGNPANAAPAAKETSSAQSVPPDKVVLKVGDESITRAELDEVVSSLSPQAQKSLAGEGRRKLGDQYATMLLLSRDALSHHLESSPAFQRLLNLTRLQLLAEAQLHEIRREATVTPEEASQYYESHQSEFDQAMIRQVVIRVKPEGAKEGTPGLSAAEAKTRAEEIRKALNSGEDVQKVAQQFQVANVIRIDDEPFPIRRAGLPSPIFNAAFELQAGQVSEVYDLKQSLLFYQVVLHKPVEFKAASSQIEKDLQQQKVDDAIAELKKNGKVWLDESYFGPPSQPVPQEVAKPPAAPAGPSTPK